MTAETTDTEALPATMTLTLTSVTFAGDEIFYAERDGMPFVPMLPVCEALGLDWSSQHRKLTSGDRDWNHGHMTMVAADGKLREMLCLPLPMLPCWLYTVSPAKVKPGLRDKLRRYQAECTLVLWQHWSGQRSAREEALTKAVSELTAGNRRAILTP